MPGFVVPLQGPNAGFPGTVSRNGDEVIVNRPLALTDTLNANFGDVAFLNQNSTGGSWSSAQALAAPAASLTGTWSGATTAVTLNSGTGVAVGQLVVGANVAPGTTVSAISGTALTLSQNTLGSETATPLFFLGASLTSTTGFSGIFATNAKVNTTYPTTGTNLVNGYYVPGQLADVAERGSVTVQLTVYSVTPVSGGQVFVRVALNPAIPAGIVGGIETAADGSFTIGLPLSIIAFKTGAVDPNGRTEVTLKTRNNP